VLGFSLVFAANALLKRSSTDVDKLMAKDEKNEVMRAYEYLKTEALCEMLKASVDSIKALKERIALLEARGQTQEEQALDMARLLAQRMDSVDKLMRGNFGFGVGKSSAQDDAAVAAAAAAAASDAAAAAEKERARAKSNAAEIEKRVQATLEEKLNDEREKQRRAKDDVDFYESLLTRKFDRFKMLYKIEDVIVAEQALQEQGTVVAGGGFGLNDDDADSVDSRYWDSPPKQQPEAVPGNNKGLVGSVVDGLQLVNPFSYLPNPFSATAQAQPQPQPQPHGLNHGHVHTLGHGADQDRERPWHGAEEQGGQGRLRADSMSSVSTEEVRIGTLDSRFDYYVREEEAGDSQGQGAQVGAPVDERDWSQPDHVGDEEGARARRVRAGQVVMINEPVNVPCYK